jgi:lipopolysaccharide/colanic/teichoic acid biosynthesis glycosyltransferase
MSAIATRSTPRSTHSEATPVHLGGARPSALSTGNSQLWKTLLDRGLAILLLIPGLPLLGFLIGLVRLTSRGPGLYSQARVGKAGRVFTMYKLRSMRIDAEAATGPVWSSAGSDSRVTRIGYWLRRLHLDELPQLFNVLRGEMSLVGPRPERPEFVKVLAQQIPDYMDRLLVLPGVTGLAQVNLPPDTDLDSVRRKLALDREYIGDAGLLLDLGIILCTILRVIGLRGGRGVRLLGLQRTVFLPPGAAPVGGDGDASPATPETIVIDKAGSSTVTYDDIRSFARKHGECLENSAVCREATDGPNPALGEI